LVALAATLAALAALARRLRVQVGHTLDVREVDDAAVDALDDEALGIGELGVGANL
jgi:hypothetical protein